MLCRSLYSILSFVFQAYFSEKHFDVGAVERAIVTKHSEFSPHSTEAVRFTSEIVGMSNHWLEKLKNGVKLDFISQPGRYREPNNKSVYENIAFVRDQVAVWITAGYVQEVAQPPWCTSPLSLVQKYDPVADVLKERLVLDLSCHVNNYIVETTVKLDDLNTSVFI